MAATSGQAGAGRTVRIVSKCATVDEFLEAFRGYGTEAVLFIPTRSPRPAGTSMKFRLELATGDAVIAGTGTVLDAFTDKSNDFGREGMRIQLGTLDKRSQRTIERLIQTAGGETQESQRSECVVVEDGSSTLAMPALSPAPAPRNDTEKVSIKTWSPPPLKSIPSMGAVKPSTGSADKDKDKEEDPPPDRDHRTRIGLAPTAAARKPSNKKPVREFAPFPALPDQAAQSGPVSSAPTPAGGASGDSDKTALRADGDSRRLIPSPPKLPRKAAETVPDLTVGRDEDSSSADVEVPTHTESDLPTRVGGPLGMDSANELPTRVAADVNAFTPTRVGDGSPAALRLATPAAKAPLTEPKPTAKAPAPEPPPSETDEAMFDTVRDGKPPPKFIEQVTLPMAALVPPSPGSRLEGTVPQAIGGEPGVPRALTSEELSSSYIIDDDDDGDSGEIGGEGSVSTKVSTSVELLPLSHAATIVAPHTSGYPAIRVTRPEKPQPAPPIVPASTSDSGPNPNDSGGLDNQTTVRNQFPVPTAQRRSLTASPPVAAALPPASASAEPAIASELPETAPRGATVKTAVLSAVIAMIVGLGMGYAMWGGGDSKKPTAAAASAASAAPAAAASRSAGVTPTAASATAEPEKETAPAAKETAPDEGGEEPETATQPAATAEPSELPETAAAAAPEAPATCNVFVDSQPNGGIAYAAGKKLGSTPYAGPAPCGTIEITVKKKYYKEEVKEIALSPDSDGKLSMKLQKKQVDVAITSSPPGATVKIDGKKVGATPVKQKVTAGSELSIKIEKAGYDDFTKSVKVEAKKVSVSAKLVEKKKPAPKVARKPKVTPKPAARPGTKPPSKPASKPASKPRSAR